MGQRAIHVFPEWHDWSDAITNFTRRTAGSAAEGVAGTKRHFRSSTQCRRSGPTLHLLNRRRSPRPQRFLHFLVLCQRSCCKSKSLRPLTNKARQTGAFGTLLAWSIWGDQTSLWRLRPSTSGCCRKQGRVRLKGAIKLKVLSVVSLCLHSQQSYKMKLDRMSRHTLIH